MVCHKAYIILVVIPSTIERYTYGNTSWGDQLTAFNGTSLSYDALGNPLSYYNGTSYTFTWEKGRQLASTVKGGVTTAYTYNADGIRTGKTVGSKTVKYVLSGSKIVAEINNGVDIRYLYDPQGSPVGMILAGTTYLYEKNLQGDIIGIYNTSGTKVASYTYDAWGNVVSSSYSDYNAYTYNPFRYRGYYYDTETGFYYLQSRYYDPTTGRFISADGVMSGSGSSVIGYNLYSYCFNNPISLQDSDGNWPEWVNEAAQKITKNISKVFTATRDAIHSLQASFTFANHVNKTHVTKEHMLDFGPLFGKVGVSTTVTKQSEDTGLFYSYSDIGNDASKVGAGINIADWLGVNVGASTDANIFVGAQITPWFHAEVSVGLDGIGIVVGIDNGDVSTDFELKAGLATILLLFVPQVASNGGQLGGIPVGG